MRRREFLGHGGRWLAAATLLPAGRLFASEPATAPPDLVLARGEARRAVFQALEALGGMGRFVREGQVVLVKPNIGFDAPPAWGATTHPDVLAAVIESCVAAKAKRVIVADHTIRPAERCFERSGLSAAVKPFANARLVSLGEESAFEEVLIPQGKVLKRARVASLAKKADVFINLPTAKSHSASRVSFGLKNLMGLVWDRQAFHSDFDLHQGIADLASVLRPHLTILDATRLLKTGGPSGPGEVEPYGGIVAGTDPVALDAYAARLAPWGGQTCRGEEIAHIRLAGELGLGTCQLETLRVLELKG